MESSARRKAILLLFVFATVFIGGCSLAQMPIPPLLAATLVTEKSYQNLPHGLTPGVWAFSFETDSPNYKDSYKLILFEDGTYAFTDLDNYLDVGEYSLYDEKTLEVCFTNEPIRVAEGCMHLTVLSGGQGEVSVLYSADYGGDLGDFDRGKLIRETPDTASDSLEQDIVGKWKMEIIGVNEQVATFEFTKEGVGKKFDEEGQLQINADYYVAGGNLTLVIDGETITTKLHNLGNQMIMLDERYTPKTVLLFTRIE